METIKVNMSPNPLDVQTIHASQNDGEAREWGFALHNNGEKIDSSSISDQLVFKSYKGGTEQILPENGAVPVTAPFVGDIKYPDATRNDQEFLYRQSPTESDGNAKIQTIYGNTLKWNQLATFTPRSGTDNGITYELKADGTIVCNGTATGISYINIGNTYQIQGHKLYIKGCPSGGSNLTYYLRDGYNGVASERDFGNGVIVTARAKTVLQMQILQGVTATNLTFTPQLFDLTAMGLDSLTLEEVKQWFADYFPLPYYAYNQGSLLSFNGNGIKTVGKNLFDFSQFANGTITFENGVLTGTAGQFYTAYGNVVNKGIELKYPKNAQITISFDARTEQNQASTGGGLYFVASENGVTVQLEATLNNTTAIQHKTVTIPSSRHIDKLGWAYGSSAQNIWHITNFQVEFGTETEYEPYTSSTLSLPISTYFTNGMKSAESVYDELTESKAITRIGSITLNGSEAWAKSASYPGNYYVLGLLNDVKYPNPTAVSNSLILVYNTTQLSANDLCFMFDGPANSQNVNIKNTSMETLDQFKAWLQANPVTIYYELTTPTETPITTASLVTENAEIPLSNEDGVLIGKCTEQLSENPGFFDAKIKLSDSDGECYSNKIQLHVERSPQ